MQGASKSRRHVGSRLFAAYAAASLVPVVLLGVVLVRDSGREALESGLQQGRAQAAVIGEMAIAPALSGADLDHQLTARERARLQDATDLAIFNGSVVRLRLRGFTGRVVFSDNGSTASACGGERADDGAAPATAFDQGLHDRLPAAILKRGTIRVGGSDPYPPAAFAPDGRTVVGFEPDLAAELGRVLGVRFEFVNLSFSDLLPQLRRHKIDVVMASMTDTAERERQADFVNYFQAGTAIIVQRGTPQGISDLKDLCGRVVAVAKDTVQVDLLRRTQKGCGAGQRIRIRPYGEQPGGYADVLRRWGVLSGALESATINAGGGAAG